MGLEMLISLLEIGLVLTHDLVGHGVARIFVFQLDRGPEDHATGGIPPRKGR